jgi:ribonuclease Z
MIAFYKIPISQRNNIKKGADWVTPEGETIANERLVTPADPVRSYAYCSDTRYIPTLHEQLRGVSTLYHESTYTTEHIARARLYYHSTAAQAAQVARDAGAGKLLLGHYSARYNNEQVLLDEARAIFPNAFLTDERMVFDV